MIRRPVVLASALVAALGCSETPTSPAPGQLAPSLKISRPFLPGEQQPSVDLDRGTLAIYPEMEGQNLTQTFTPPTTQLLGYLQLPVGCVAGVLLNVKIRAGVGGAILYEANRVGLPEVVDGTFQSFQVYDAATSQGIKLKRGRAYAIELAAFPGPEAAGTTCGLARGPVGDSYTGGRGFYRDPINGTDWLPLPSGLATDQEDLPFVTLVR
jgi:hypothetical protein